MSANKPIDFFRNWNGKLFCEAFSTIRLKNDRYKVGERYDITLNDQWCGDAEIVHLVDFKLSQMKESMSYLDTGFGVRETIEQLLSIYGNDVLNETFTYIVLKRLTKDYHLNLHLNAFKPNIDAAVQG